MMSSAMVNISLWAFLCFSHVRMEVVEVVVEDDQQTVNATFSMLPNCFVSIGGLWHNKSVGETWTLPEEPCLTHNCQMTEQSETNNGGQLAAVERISREYCHMSCHNEYELITLPNQCCGQCIQTKCRTTNGTVRNVGEMWKEPTNNCTYHECIRTADNRIEIADYLKSCPPAPRKCPRNRLIIKDCCQVCAASDDANVGDALAFTAASSASSNAATTTTNDTADSHTFTFDNDLESMLKDPATYRNHPCARECQSNGAPLVCNYTFHVEWYETLSKACYDCPRTLSDCGRPHCIAGDGMARSIVVINRMMPGPRLQVCFGDTLVVDVHNKLMGESTTLHWHGMHQRETPLMDGVPMVTQCPIGPHSSFRYTFRADHEGTHWWHSHTGMQRSDGALGALIVRRPRVEEPPAVSALYAHDLAEHTLIVQDWDHVSAVASFNSFHHSLGNNKPKNILINAKGRYVERTLVVANPTVVNTNVLSDVVDVVNMEVSATPPPLPDTTEFMPNDVDWLQMAGVETGRIVESGTDAVAEETTVANRPSVVDIQQRRLKRQTMIVDSVQPAASIPTAAVDGTFSPPLEVFRIRAGAGGYRFRHINAGFLNCPVEISIDQHNLTVIASDGWYVEPVEVSTLVSYAGERFDFVVRADQTVGNYWVRVRGLMDCDERFTKANQVAVLRYDGAAEDEWPTAEWPTYEFERRGLQMNALNRGTGLVESVSIAELTSLHESDPKLLLPEADFKFYVYYDFYDKDNPHFNHPGLYSNQDMATGDTQFIGPQLNRITMKMPSSPFMVARDRIDATKFCNESSLAARNIDCSAEFCECSHVLQVPLNATVELVLVDEGYRYDANHPFHLHGHGFQVVAMERLRPSGITIEEIQELDRAGQIPRRLRGAPTKDTITVPDGGYTIVRFVADNPGYWLFHCHIEFHSEVGMAIVFKIGEHEQMRPVPPDFPQCSSYRGDTMGFEANSANSATATNGWNVWLVWGTTMMIGYGYKWLQ